MTDLNATADRIVRQDIHLCLSSMISNLALAGDANGAGRAVCEMIEQAVELCMPGLDYEAAAREAGFVQSDADHAAIGKPEAIDAGDFDATYDSWEDACDAEGIEPHEWEVYEHWAVSEWLARKLIAHGERVDMDFTGLCVWARTTTGQAISMDSVIQRIAADIDASR